MKTTQSIATAQEIVAIMVGGGPAPGINGVISAATIEANNRGLQVLGLEDGFHWLLEGDTSKVRKLDYTNVNRIYFQGGSILGTSRANPKTPEQMQKVLTGLHDLGVKYLIAIGGDDTAFAAYNVGLAARGSIKVVHVPKTIDNDLPLPGAASTFGFQTARHVGVNIVLSLMVDASTTHRWYIVVSMGRKAGHLALGIGKAAAATLTIIGEEFNTETIRLSQIVDILEGAIIKRLANHKDYGVAVLAEGLIEKVDKQDLKKFKEIPRDPNGHLRLREVDFGRILKPELLKRLKARKINLDVVSKDVGYELRCAQPIPFDCEYTRDLGFLAVQHLLDGGNGAMITREGGRLKPLSLESLIDPQTKKIRLRLVNVGAESYQVARKYMIRLEASDFQNPSRLAALAKAAGMTQKKFRDHFEHIIWEQRITDWQSRVFVPEAG